MEREIMVVAMTAIICGTIIIGTALQAFATRRSRRVPLANTEVIEARLARMEQAIDAVALEVERIAEGQRFTTKLLSEARGDGMPVPRKMSS